MAKESMKAREVKRVKLANRYAHKREEIAAKVKSGEMDHEEAWIALSKLPRNSNPIRQHNRCKITGRPKGYIRLFGISRIQFREMASKGLIPESKLVIFSDAGNPGIRKSVFLPGCEAGAAGMRPAQEVRMCRSARRRRIPEMSLDTEGVCPWEKAGQEQFLYRTVKCRDDGAAAGLPAVPSFRRNRGLYGCRTRVVTSQCRGKCRRKR